MLLMISHTWLRPDSKTQVSVEYIDGKPSRITAVVVSTMHAKEITTAEIREALKGDLIEKVLPQDLLTEDTKYHINPTGLFVCELWTMLLLLIFILLKRQLTIGAQILLTYQQILTF